MDIMKGNGILDSFILPQVLEKKKLQPSASTICYSGEGRAS